MVGVGASRASQVRFRARPPAFILVLLPPRPPLQPPPEPPPRRPLPTPTRLPRLPGHASIPSVELSDSDPRPGRVTIRQVAELAGVSIATVSRVAN